MRDIYIDADGHQWLATDEGLSVLDDNGTADKADDAWYTYTRETTGGNLPSDRVTAVAMDEAGYLWIGTGQYWDAEAQAYVGGYAEALGLPPSRYQPCSSSIGPTTSGCATTPRFQRAIRL